MVLAPENTRESFAAAAGMGVEAIEADVRLSKDGEAGLDSRCRAAPHTRSSWRCRRPHDGGTFSHWPAPLNTLLTEFGADFDIYIDLKEKSARLADAVGRVVRESGAEARAWVTGSDLKQLSGCSPLRLASG